MFNYVQAASLVHCSHCTVSIDHEASRGQSSPLNIIQDYIHKGKEPWTLNHCVPGICHRVLARGQICFHWCHVWGQNLYPLINPVKVSVYAGNYPNTSCKCEVEHEYRNNLMLITFKNIHSCEDQTKWSHLHFNSSAHQEAVSQLGVLLNANVSENPGGGPPVCVCPRK